METNKLSKLNSENGILKGGFTTLTILQLEKLKGGSGDTNYCPSNKNCPSGCTSNFACFKL